MTIRVSVFFFLLMFGCWQFATAQSNGNQSPQAPAQNEPAGGGQARPNQTYALGDQVFLINAGIFLPLFFQDESGNVAPTNLSLGGVGSLEWNAYLNNNLSLGVEFGGTFSFSPNGHGLFLIPITGDATWTFRVYPFEIPVSLGAGVNFLLLNDQVFFGPVVKPGIGGYWDISSKWALGVRAVYWWVPEIYLGDSPPSSHSRFGNFLEIGLSAIYHF